MLTLAGSGGPIEHSRVHRARARHIIVVRRGDRTWMGIGRSETSRDPAPPSAMDLTPAMLLSRQKGRCRLSRLENPIPRHSPGMSGGGAGARQSERTVGAARWPCRPARPEDQGTSRGGGGPYIRGTRRGKLFFFSVFFWRQAREPKNPHSSLSIELPQSLSLAPHGHG